MTYCKEKGSSYKSRLSELDIPAWKFCAKLSETEATDCYIVLREISESSTDGSTEDVTPGDDLLPDDSTK